MIGPVAEAEADEDVEVDDENPVVDVCEVEDDPDADGELL